MGVRGKILVGLLLVASYLFLVLAGKIVPSFFAVGFMVLSGSIFYGRISEYKEKMGKFYLVCEIVWGMLFLVVSLLFIHTFFLTRLGGPNWAISLAVGIIFGFFMNHFVNRLFVGLKKKG